MRYKGKSATKVRYSGNITGKLMLGDIVVKKFNLHNSGGNALFQFLVMCLAGEYSTVDPMRPAKIMLFNNNNMNISSGAELSQETDITPLPTHSASNFLATTSAATIKDSSIVLHFIVPFTNITQTSINEIGLYGANIQDVSNYSALFMITDAEGKVSPIEASGQLSNMALMLDWELSFIN